MSVDRLVAFAGWWTSSPRSSAVEPVNGPTTISRCLSRPASAGDRPKTPLLGLVDAIAPMLAGGNVVSPSQRDQVRSRDGAGGDLRDHDVPGGVVNILTDTTTN